MDRNEKLTLSIVTGRYLDPAYRDAINSDFRRYTEDEYNTIADYVRSKIDEANITSSGQPVEGAVRAHREISRIIELSFGFVRSRLRRWALDLLKDAINTHDDDLEVEKALNTKIIQMFKDSPPDFSETLTEITIFLYLNCDLVQSIHIATCLYQFGEKIKNSRKVFEMNEYSEEFFNVVTHLIRKSKRNFDAQGIGTALYSLQNLPDCEEIRALIDAISDSFEYFEPEMDVQGVGISLYGLQNMHESKEILHYIKALTKSIAANPPKLDARAVSQAFFGIQNIIHLDETEGIREYLMAQLDNLDPAKMTNVSTLSLIQALRIVSIPVPNPILQRYDEFIYLNSNQSFASGSELYAFRLAGNIFPNKAIFHNHFIDGFELDIYIPDKKLNIEIDGEYHGVNSVREDKRDQHLIEKHGISIVRIPIERLIDEVEFKRKIHATLAAV